LLSFVNLDWNCKLEICGNLPLGAIRSGLIEEGFLGGGEFLCFRMGFGGEEEEVETLAGRAGVYFEGGSFFLLLSIFSMFSR